MWGCKFYAIWVWLAKFLASLLLAINVTTGGSVAITFEQFFRAIVEQESGGDYDAVGVMTSYGRAYGKYQVLESNIPGWT